MGKKTVPPRGMNDIPPQAAQRKEALIRQLIPVYNRWGFTSIETPAMEKIDRLIGSDGGDNEKLVFQVLRRGLDKDDFEQALTEPQHIVDMGLRYDLTVPLARFYATNHAALPQVCKFLQYGPVWRAERPQKGRFRQFTQWDADIVGASEGLPEIQLMLCSAEALKAVGLEGFTIRFNDRRVLKALVQAAGIEPSRHDEAFIVIDKLDKVGIEGIEQELEERGFAQDTVSHLVEKLTPFLNTKVDSLEQGLEQLGIALPEETLASLKLVFNEVKQHADHFSLVFDPTLVRGMGYYTGQIFEIEYEDYPFSIAGGGRYDGMIGRFLGKEIPACGFSLGFDRIITILNDKDSWSLEHQKKKVVLLAQKSDVHEALLFSQQLREQQCDVSLEFKAKNIKRQLEEFKAIGFTHFCLYNPANTPDIKEID